MNCYNVKDRGHRQVAIRAKSNERLDLERNVDQFRLRVARRKSDIATGQDGRRAVALVEGILRSARAGRAVKLR